MIKFAMLVVAALAIAASCPTRPPLIALEAGPPLRLVAAAGVRINARLKPALELDDGRVVRFTSPRLTPDSAYFATAPTADAPDGAPRRGTLRVSICSSGEAICRSLELAVAW